MNTPGDDFRGKRVTVMGLGSFGGGVGVTRWLAARGAQVTVTDLADEKKLANSVHEISVTGATLHLGGHNERDFRDADLVVANPAVPDSSPFLAAAHDAHVPITTEINLFVERCRGITVGVTGSVGKSTTTAMVEHVLKNTRYAAPPSASDASRTAGGGRDPSTTAVGGCPTSDRDNPGDFCLGASSGAQPRVWLGGNIGASLLDQLPHIDENDVVLLELSSFQLHRTPAARWSPRIAALTNIVPNHLDWHGTIESYLADKLNIFAFQDLNGEVVIGPTPALCDVVAGWRMNHPRGFWTCHIAADGAPVAMRHAANAPAERADSLRWESLQLQVPGRHNLENAGVALTIAHLCGVELTAAMTALASFAGLPHRLQRVAVRDGVTYFNDSKSTTPDAAITAIDAFAPTTPLLVILGGYDKHIDLTPAARRAAERAKFAACIGATGPALAAAVQAAGGEAIVLDSFEAAVRECRRRAAAGDVVLLSPACASWGMFADYRERGDVFTRLVTSETAP